MTIHAPAFWATKNTRSRLLYPLALLYAAAAAVHRLWRGRKPYSPSVPVISVGNLVVGGSGKTPLVALLAKHFTQKGETVAILSRGYGRTTEEKACTPHLVTEKDTAAAVGDEPKMLFNQSVAAQIWVGACRVRSARAAEEAGATLLILDDGFQYAPLTRQVDIVVADGALGFGNGYPLPAGPLRESLCALKRADVVAAVNVPAEESSDAWQQRWNVPCPVLNVHRGLSAESVKPAMGKPVLAFCALGFPERFWESLTQAGLNVTETISYPDHHPFSDDDIRYLQRRAKELEAVLVTTAKDAVRLPADMASACVVAQLEVEEVSAQSLVQKVEDMLKEKKK